MSGAEGYIYFAEMPGLPFIKIGYSAHPEARLDTLATTMPVKLVLLATCPGTFRHESRLHYIFGAIRARGEWFRAEEPLLSFVARVKETGVLTLPEVQPRVPQPPRQAPDLSRRRGRRPQLTPEQEAIARDAMSEAVERAGNPTRLATALGILQGNVYSMAKKKGYAIPEYALQIEAITGVHRSRLRPDIWPPHLFPPPNESDAA